jgi:hypothetical protein
MRDHSFGQRQHDLAATRNALPDLGLGLHFSTGFLILAGAEYLVLVTAFVPTPACFDLDPIGITSRASMASTWRETVEALVCRAAAAGVRPPLRATARKYLRSFQSSPSLTACPLLV